MRIIVTGGSGFIGAHVVDRLLDAGHDVISLDLNARMTDPRADHRIVDVLDLSALTTVFTGCDMVFHLAGMSNVDHAFADPIRTVRLNVEGTANVCEAARATGVRRVLFASTVWVYGASGGDLDDPRSLTEDVEFAMSRAGHVYTSTKIAAELLLQSYQQTYGLDFTVLRYGIPYGPGMRDELVLARFLRKALNGEPLTVAGDGQQFRNYVFVRDLADAHVLAMDDAARNETIALEGNERVSVLAMAQAVQDHFPGVEIEHVPARPGDFRGRSVSNAKAERLLGWRPITGFADGVRQYVEWYLADRQPTSDQPVSARRADGVGAPVSSE
ncbi:MULTISPECIES: NAD(P)-dependent oxidoreductase [unclassified Frankia]|uniref:NAD-dependent epimerase/dehydratase family protein n=1 Tax=unclassified Frankia TaxID=2632575 RepID=UPI001EF5DE35|nr:MULTISPECIES: NAD-dependent epimerase/dehydratase family protein [unclassified Frankia]